MNLTPEAQSALLSTVPRVGGAVTMKAGAPTLRELLAAGLISRTHCLTRQGLTQRNRIMDARMDAAFS